MVTQQKYYSRDPNGLGRGPGYYYLRGGKRPGSKKHTYTMPSGQVKTITGPYYSKYSKRRDEERLSKGHSTHNIGTPEKISKKFGHVTDGRITERLRR